MPSASGKGNTVRVRIRIQARRSVRPRSSAHVGERATPRCACTPASSNLPAARSCSSRPFLLPLFCDGDDEDETLPRTSGGRCISTSMNSSRRWPTLSPPACPTHYTRHETDCIPASILREGDCGLDLAVITQSSRYTGDGADRRPGHQLHAMPTPSVLWKTARSPASGSVKHRPPQTTQGYVADRSPTNRRPLRSKGCVCRGGVVLDGTCASGLPCMFHHFCRFEVSSSASEALPLQHAPTPAEHREAFCFFGLAGVLCARRVERPLARKRSAASVQHLSQSPLSKALVCGILRTYHDVKSKGEALEELWTYNHAHERPPARPNPDGRR